MGASVKVSPSARLSKRSRTVSYHLDCRQPMQQTVLDTIGKLYAHGHGLFGYCKVCQRACIVSMVALVRERVGDSRVVSMKPLECPGCGGRRTSFTITAPSKGRPWK
jgi:hypothetical protein